MQEAIQDYLDSYKPLRGKFGRKDLERIADHFGGVLTSSGRYVKIRGKEYSIYFDAFDCRLKVRHMNWEHGDNFKYTRRY